MVWCGMMWCNINQYTYVISSPFPSIHLSSFGLFDCVSFPSSLSPFSFSRTEVPFLFILFLERNFGRLHAGPMYRYPRDLETSKLLACFARLLALLPYVCKTIKGWSITLGRGPKVQIVNGNISGVPILLYLGKFGQTLT